MRQNCRNNREERTGRGKVRDSKNDNKRARPGQSTAAPALVPGFGRSLFFKFPAIP